MSAVNADLEFVLSTMLVLASGPVPLDKICVSSTVDSVVWLLSHDIVKLRFDLSELVLSLTGYGRECLVKIKIDSSFTLNWLGEL